MQPIQIPDWAGEKKARSATYTASLGSRLIVSSNHRGRKGSTRSDADSRRNRRRWGTRHCSTDPQAANDRRRRCQRSHFLFAHDTVFPEMVQRLAPDGFCSESVSRQPRWKEWCLWTVVVVAMGGGKTSSLRRCTKRSRRLKAGHDSVQQSSAKSPFSPHLVALLPRDLTSGR